MRLASAVLLALALAGVSAGEAAPEANPTPGKTPQVQPKRLTAMQLIAEEEKWVFRAPVGRVDVLIDRELELLAWYQLKNKENTAARSPGASKSTNQPELSDAEQLLTWAKAEQERVRQSLTARRYDEAMKASDSALKVLDSQVARPEVAAVVVAIRTYRAQAEEAKIRDDAQAAFEALRLKVLGVLWSQDGMRMAIIQGENRALTVNDRVKDCAVINIDQDRVDFRFVFNRRRFEFPVYVDTNVRAKP